MVKPTDIMTVINNITDLSFDTRMRDRQDAVRNVSEGIHFRGARANGSEPSPMVKPPDIMTSKK